MADEPNVTGGWDDPLLDAFYSWLTDKIGAISAYMEVYYGILGFGTIGQGGILENLQANPNFQEWLGSDDPAVAEWQDRVGEAGTTPPEDTLWDTYFAENSLPQDTDISQLTPDPAWNMEWVLEEWITDPATGAITGKYPEPVWVLKPIAAEEEVVGQIFIPEEIYGGLIQKPDGSWTDAYGNDISDEWRDWLLDNQFGDSDEELGFFGGDVISEGGYDYWVTYNEDGTHRSKSPIAPTKDKGTSEYDAALLEIQQGQLAVSEGQLAVSEGQLGLDILGFEGLSAWQQAQLELMGKPWEGLTFAEQAQFDFDREIFEQQKLQWEQEFANLQSQQAFEQQQWADEMARNQYEFGNLSAQQESQRELELRGLGLQERIAQTEINKRPMDWMAAWQWSNPTWSGQPRGTPNPNATPNIPIPQGGFPPLGGN